LATVTAQLRQLAAGAVLLGYGINSDLQALGMQDHPAVYDLLAWHQFGGRQLR
jgi:hypothetical protein